MAVNFAHEIEHTTSENIKLVYEKYSKEAIEEYPDLISQNMISEFYITKPLDNLDALYRLIEEMLQEEDNIQIDFK